MKQLVSFFNFCLFFVIFFIFSSQVINGQKTYTYTDLRYNSLSTKDGLSQSSVLCMTQDKYGFLWMGTKDGLNRFDGYQFLNYKHIALDSGSISNNDIISLLTDSKGDILVGTRGGGFNKFIYSTNRFIQYPLFNDKECIVNALSEAPDSTIWLGTSEGLIKGTPGNKHRYTFEHLSQKSVFKNFEGSIIPRGKSIMSITAIYIIDSSKLLIGTGTGIFEFNPNDLCFNQLNYGILNESKITSIAARYRNDIWIGSSEGIANIKNFNQSNQQINYYNDNIYGEHKIDINWINSLICDNNDNIWVGSRGGGLIKITPENNLTSFTKETGVTGHISDNMINSLLIDRKGVLWIGTESRGCNSIDLYRKKFKYLPGMSAENKDFTNSPITAITGNKPNEIWIGTAFNGIGKISFLDNSRYQLKHFEQIPYESGKYSREIISLYMDKDNNLWIGSASNSIVRYNEKNGFKTFNTNGFVFSIHQDKENTIWFGTWGNGLYYYDPTTSTFNNIPELKDNFNTQKADIILSFFDDINGNLWIGTKGGGIYITPRDLLKNNQTDFINYRYAKNSKKPLSHNDVYCIFQSKKGDIWIGTGEGLNKVVFPEQDYSQEAILQGKIKFESYYETDGLPNNVIYGILEDKSGNLWLSTNKGICVFNPETKKIKNYNMQDGIQSEEYHSNAYFSSDFTHFFFGGIKGLTFFNPTEISDNPFDAEVLLTGLYVMNKKVAPNEKVNGKTLLTKDVSETKKIILNHKHKEFSFEFSAMHYANLQNITYAYRLKGFNENWNTTKNNERQATYTNLMEGNYTFEVKATNDDGTWSDNIARIVIEVRPPLWRNPWFYIVYAAIIIFLLLVLRNYTIINVTEKNRLHIESIEQSKQVEVTEAKMRFFTNISHEIRTPLMMINGPLEQIFSEGNIDEHSRNNLKVVLKNVQRLINLTNQLLNLRKIDRGVALPKYTKVNTYNFIKDILEYFEQQGNPKGISVQFNSEEITNELWIDLEMITTTLYNILSNAYKYTNENGQIRVRIKNHTGNPGKTNYKNIGKRKKQNINDWIKIEIEDTGTGIPPSELSYVFNRFYQVDNNSKNEYSGSGIGLSLVKEYIELHLGYIDVISEVNKGTCFMVYLPLGNKHISEDQIKDDPNSNVLTRKILENKFNIYESNEAITLPSKKFDKYLPTILLVDDNLEMLKYITENLSVNYNIIPTDKAKDGILIANQSQPNLIISDVMMPEINGLELCETIKTNIETSHIPIILLTAKATEDNILEGYEYGADLYVTKPFSLAILEAQIKHILQTRTQLIEKYSRKIYLNPREISITRTDENFLKDLIAVVEDNLSEADFDVSKLVKKMNISHSTLLKKVKVLTGDSVVDFVKRFRLKKAAMILEKDDIPINELAYTIGFSDPKYFSKCFKEEFGCPPSEFVKLKKDTKEQSE